MTRGVETRLDGETLVVRIPMKVQRRGGRKRIVAPDGSAIVPTSRPQLASRRGDVGAGGRPGRRERVSTGAVGAGG